MNPKVDAFISKAKRWQPEMKKLREIALSCGLTEELKWYQPCYSYQGSNLLIISGFKEYCLLGFFKGALLKDPKKILSVPGANTQSARQARFKNLAEIKKLEPVLKAYIREAIAAEKAGLKVEFKKITEHQVPVELEKKLNASAAFKKAFRSLTPGRQRAYLLHFSGAKQAATREARIEKHRQRIMKGKGLND